MTRRSEPWREQLREWRLSHAPPRTQQQLADAIKVSSISVSRWERGTATPRFDEARRLAAETWIRVYEEAVTTTDRLAALEYAVSELIVALREGGAGSTQRSASALENAMAAMAAAAPAPESSPSRARRPTRKDR